MPRPRSTDRETSDDSMTITRGARPKPPSPDARRTPRPGRRDAHAAAVERARKSMLDDARPRRRTRIGADVVCEALLRQGVDVFFSYPGGVILPLYDVLGDYPELRHILVRHEQGGAHAADGYARVDRPRRRLHGHVRPGRHEPRHRHRHRAPRLRPDGRDHRQRARRAHRQGRVPGDRHQRHHAADDEAQLPGPQRRRPAAGHRRGVPHRPHRPARARSTSTSRRTPSSRRRAPSTRPTRRSSPACPASGRTSTANGRQLKLAARGDRQREAAGDPRRPRRPPRRGLGRPRRVRREDPDPGRPHAARHRGDRRDATRSATASWACTAGSTSTGRSSRPTCCSRSGCASTTASPATSGPTRRTPGSSTSTSTRPRSARTSRSRSRSSATRGASCGR